MKKILLASAMIMAMSGPALAQGYDDGYDDPMTGLYVGAMGGYGWNDSDTPAAGVDLDVDGASYGVFVGYKIDQWLESNLGMTGAVEAHFDWSSADDSVGTTSADKDYSWGVQFRPGISISDTINPYGIIGYERANFDLTAPGFSGDEDFDGFELGLGTELVSYGDIGVRLEYSHTWYGEEAGFDPDEHEVRAGIAYHF